MAEPLGGKKGELGGHRTTDRRLHGRGNNTGSVVETKAFGGGHRRLAQGFISALAVAHSGNFSQPQPPRIAPPKIKTGG